MARYTVAYSSFAMRLDEVETLREFALKKERLDPVNLRREINALCRGAIVLLSSHFEAYVKETGELALDSLYEKAVIRNDLAPRFYYHISKDFLDEVKDTSDPDRIAEKVFRFLQSDGAYWSRSGSFSSSLPVERFNKGFSNPAFSKIKKYFNRFGYSDYSRDLSSNLQAQFYPITNMIDHLVDTRNKIAHGDPTASKTPSEVKDMIVMVKKYCAATDSVFATWWKANFCTIR